MFRTGLARGILAVSVIAAACDNDPLMDPMSAPPPVQMVMPGMATLQGVVLDESEDMVAGAQVTMLDTPIGQTITTATDANGAWTLVVPGDTALVLKVEKTGFARTLSPGVRVAKGGRSEGMELMVVSSARIEALNTMAGPRVNDYGVIGVDVLSTGCDPEGGQLSLPVMPNAKVVYNRDGAKPDPSLTTIQERARPAAWIIGALPPGTYYQVTFTKAGCTQKAMPMEFAGRTYSGHLPLEAKAFSNGVLFVE